MAYETSDQTIRKFSQGFENCDAFRSCAGNSAMLKCWNVKLDKTTGLGTTFSTETGHEKYA